MNDRDQYSDKSWILPSRFLKYISKYNYSSEEMQDIQQTNMMPVSSQVLDLSAAAPNSNPFIVNQPGRAVVIYGINDATGDSYDPLLNTGIEPVSTTAFVFARFNDQNADFFAGIPLKHNRGFKGTFSKLILTWPAQATTKARLVIFNWDGMPWLNGEAAT